MNLELPEVKEPLLEKLAQLKEELTKAKIDKELAGTTDLRENAPYWAAKDKIEKELEPAIAKINLTLATAKYIDVVRDNVPGRVSFGACVFLTPLDPTKVESRLYRIVGKSSVDANKNWISYESPVGQKLYMRSLLEPVSLEPDEEAAPAWQISSIFYDPDLFVRYFQSLAAGSTSEAQSNPFRRSR